MATVTLRQCAFPSAGRTSIVPLFDFHRSVDAIVTFIHELNQHLRKVLLERDQVNYMLQQSGAGDRFKVQFLERLQDELHHIWTAVQEIQALRGE